MHTDESITARILQRRHKYETGLTWVVGGSDGLLGAAVVAGKAAWKTGCGAVILYVTRRTGTGCRSPGTGTGYPGHITGRHPELRTGRHRRFQKTI